jgi:hypothetical protein
VKFRGGSEPALLALNVGPHKLFVRLREINDALDYTDDAAGPARENRDNDLNDALVRVTQDELVNAQTTDQDSENTSQDLFIRAECFPIRHRSRGNSLRLITATAADSGKLRLAVGAELGHLVVDGAAFCAVSGHLVSSLRQRAELHVAEQSGPTD